VDWLSGTGDMLQISNQAVHHAILLLDIFAARQITHCPDKLAALAALLVSAKFLQMKYPSAESLNSCADYSYSA
jgi:hypothetical protein